MKINYFNYKKIKDDCYLLTNDFGSYCFLNEDKFRHLVADSIDYDEELFNKGFIIEDDLNKAANRLKSRYREMKKYLLSSTCLHIFVLTSDCNFRCLYCQARDENNHKSGLMSKEIAKKCVDIALQSPDKVLSFEFQGGEPLLNFSTLKYIVEYANKNKGYHDINYSVVTNISLLDESIINYFKDNKISMATSLDGPKEVQDINRPFSDGEGSYDTVCSNIKRVKENGQYIGAIETTSKYNLDKYKETIDTYVSLGLCEIFIRPLTKLGTAANNWDEIGYSSSSFKEYYRKSLLYILELNINGTKIKEGHASVFLQKIIGNYSNNYMELRSPCGASIGQRAYFFDGNIFTCDEGRMMYEMGDDAFLIGNVNNSNHSELIKSSITKTLMLSSMTELLPACNECVYQPYCGVCPVATYGETKNIFNNQCNNFRCELYKGILDVLFEILSLNNSEYIKILNNWL